MRPGCLIPLAFLAACASPSTPLPRDLPHPDQVEIHETEGFTYFLDRDCLSDDELDALHEELSRSREFLIGWLGPGLAPGDFRPRGTPRETCPPDWEFGPVPELAPVEVVVLAHGGRCHADGDGVAVVRGHIARGDATHELVHYLSGSSWHPIDEGLATWLTEQIEGPDDHFPLMSRARVYRDLSLTTFLTPRELGERMNRRDYDVAGAFVGWLVESFGKPRFLELYAGAGRNFFPIYGIGERELVERFWAHVGSLDVKQDGAYYGFKALLQGRE